MEVAWPRAVSVGDSWLLETTGSGLKKGNGFSVCVCVLERCSEPPPCCLSSQCCSCDVLSNTCPKSEQSCGRCLEEQLSSKSHGESCCDARRSLLLSGGLRFAFLFLPLLLHVGAPEPAAPGSESQPAPAHVKNDPTKPFAVPPPPCARSASELALLELMGVSAWSPMQAYYYNEWSLQFHKAGDEVRVPHKARQMSSQLSRASAAA